jgi:hypothetical protein
VCGLLFGCPHCIGNGVSSFYCVCAESDTHFWYHMGGQLGKFWSLDVKQVVGA